MGEGAQCRSSLVGHQKGPGSSTGARTVREETVLQFCNELRYATVAIPAETCDLADINVMTEPHGNSHISEIPS